MITYPNPEAVIAIAGMGSHYLTIKEIMEHVLSANDASLEERLECWTRVLNSCEQTSKYICEVVEIAKTEVESLRMHSSDNITMDTN